jgi:hypothetical protein
MVAQWLVADWHQKDGTLSVVQAAAVTFCDYLLEPGRHQDKIEQSDIANCWRPLKWSLQNPK